MSDAGVKNPAPDNVNPDPDEDEIDVELRSSVEVRTRVLILAAVLRRLALEGVAREGDSESLADAFDEREWLREQCLLQDLTPREAALLDSPLGSVAPEAILETSWQGEALVALGWAIRAHDMPPTGTFFNLRSVIESVPRPWDDIQHWLGDPAIVSEEEAVREREVAEIWHWRVTAEGLRRGSSTADRQDYDDAIRDVAVEASAAGLVPALHEGDFTLGGRSIKELSANHLDELVALTTQRVRALNWLCGFGASWDDVPIDV
jgi:hypothetical protein